MSAYMAAVLVCAAVTALTELLSPDNESIRKYIKYISGLTALSVIVAPLFSAIQSPTVLPDFIPDTYAATDYEYSMDEAIISEAERSLAVSVKTSLIGEFGMNGEDIDVLVSLSREDSADVRLISVAVTLRHSAAWTDTAAAERFIKQNYGKDTEVKIIYE